jgi:hypothetical protein
MHGAEHRTFGVPRTPDPLAEPDELGAVVEVAECADDPDAGVLLGLEQFSLEELDQVISRAGSSVN